MANSSELLRVYWYDGPSKNGKGPDHQAIDDLDFFKLRLGTRNMTGQQKAVDGLIIADMLSLTQYRAIDDAILISGDADLTPGVTAVQAMGLRVHLVVLEPRNATSPYLAAEADRKRYLDADWIKHFAAASLTKTAIAKEPQADISSNADALSGHDSSQSARGFTLPVNDVAAKVLQEIREGDQTALLAQCSKGADPLPREIDGKLLYTGKSFAGRNLSEVEKRELRAAFKKHL